MTTPQGINAPFNQSFYGGSSGGTTEVPGRFEVSLAGHTYKIDRAADLNGFRQEHHARRSIPVLRAQADVGLIPSEASINRENLWRRSQESWHHGAGQTYLDRQASDPYRFLSSRGVNVWNQWSLALLPDTVLSRASTNTNLRLTSCGATTYVTDGNNLLFTTDAATFTAVTGTPALPALFVTSDGFNTYTAYGSGGVYTTTRGAAAATAYNTLPTTLLGYVKGRLMAANGPSIYNITSATVPVALLTQANTDFTWVGFAEGPGFIFAAGFSGTRSLIYKIGLTTDATSLSAPIVAGELPTGEIVRSVRGYLGFVLIGTDFGVRLASVGGSGDLTIGPLIPTTSPVLNFEPADKFVWYGLSNYDSTGTGLGRLDLSTFTQALTPSYASDLLAATQGAVTSISTFGGKRIFGVSGQGFYLEASTLTASGSLSTGRITYGVGDDKVGMFLDLRHEPLNGQVTVAVAANGATPSPIGGSTTAGTVSNPFPLNVNQLRAERFDVTLTLVRDVTLGPVVTRYTLRSYPAPTRSFTITVPLLLHSTFRDKNDNDVFLDTLAERIFLEGLCRSQQLVTYQEAGQAYQVLVDDFTWIPIKPNGQMTGYDGTFVVNLKEVSQ